MELGEWVLWNNGKFCRLQRHSDGGCNMLSELYAMKQYTRSGSGGNMLSGLCHETVHQKRFRWEVLRICCYNKNWKLKEMAEF